MAQQEIRPVPVQTLSSDKPDIQNFEIKDFEKSEGVPEGTIMKSPFEDLDVRQTWSTFRKCVFICLFAGFSAAAE